MDLFENFAYPVAKLPVWIMRLELSHVADPPDVVADAIGFIVGPVQFFAADFFAHLDSLEHGTVAVPAASDVIDFPGARRANEFDECFNQVETVDVVAHLFAFVTENAVRPTGHSADHQIGKKTMQFRSRVRRSGETTAAERYRRHSEIAAVFLDQDVSGDF